MWWLCGASLFLKAERRQHGRSRQRNIGGETLGIEERGESRRRKRAHDLMEILFSSITFTSAIQRDLSEDTPPKSCLHTITALSAAASVEMQGTQP